MAFADPQSVTVNAVPISMPRISSESSKSVYASADGLNTMTISHLPSGDRLRSMVRLESLVNAADPFDASKTFQQKLVFYFVVDKPAFGFTPTEIDYRVQALKTWATSAFVLKVLGRET